MTEEQEQKFVEITDEARRRLFTGAGAEIPEHLRHAFLAGIQITHTSGKVIGTLADSTNTLLRRLRKLDGIES